MINDGWIKIHRKITEHWIWKNSQYVHAWMTILMTVNYETKRNVIQGEVIDCGRGQSLLSLQNWTRLFGNNWTIQKTRTFFDLLKADEMINTEGLHKTTRLTVCKYDDYQDIQQADNMQNNPQNEQHTDNMHDDQKTTCQTSGEPGNSSGEQQTDNKQEVENLTTTKEVKKIRRKEELVQKNIAAVAATSIRKTEFLNSLKHFKGTYPAEMIKAFAAYWCELNKSKTRMRFETEKTWETDLRLGTWARREFNNHRSPVRTTGRPGQIMQPDETRKAELLAKFETNAANGN